MSSTKTLAILQARMTSSRLPGKVLMNLCGKPMIVHQLERIRRARLLDKVIVATSTEPSDDILVETVEKHNVSVFRGSLDDVLDRFSQTLSANPSDHIVRLTADCPLADPNVIDAIVAHHFVCAADVTSNSSHPTFPNGLDVEVVTAAALNIAATEAKFNFEREHVTQFFYRRRDRFKVIDYKLDRDLSSWRWTVDYPQDFQFVSEVYRALYASKPQFDLWDVYRLIASRPEIAQMNAGFKRNEALAKSIAIEAKAEGL